MNANDVSGILSLFAKLFRRSTIYSTLLLVSISMSLAAYFNTLSLRIALGVFISAMAFTYIIGMVFELFAILWFDILPEEIEVLKYLSLVFQSVMLLALGQYLVGNFLYFIIYYRIIFILGVSAHILARLYYVSKLASKRNSRNYVVVDFSDTTEDDSV